MIYVPTQHKALTHKPYSGVSSLGHIKPLTSTSTTSSLGLDEFSAQLGQTSLQYTNVVSCGLVALSASHLWEMDNSSQQ